MCLSDKKIASDKKTALFLPDLSLIVQARVKMSSYIQAGQVVPKDDDVELSCVICVGSTGAGKSATISKCTKRPVSSGNGRDRVTVRCAKYDLRTDAKEALEALRIDKDVIDLNWVDTVGWDDADLQGKSMN